MKDKAPEIIYSEPVNEIISNPPARIIRWGTVVIAFVFLLLIFLAWIIRYPDIVPAEIEITTQNPPVTLVTNTAGRIYKLYVHDREKVAPGQLLALLETSASIPEVEALKKLADTIVKPEKLDVQSIPAFSKLGELQVYYDSFIKALQDYDTYNRNDLYGSKINSINEEISALHQFIGRMKVKEKLITDNLRTEDKRYRRDSALYAGKELSENEYETSRRAYNNSKLDLQQVRLDESKNLVTLAEKNQLLQDYRIRREEEVRNLVSVLNESFLNLNEQINIWRNNYLFVSPVEDTVTFTRSWSENQSVLKYEPLLSIVPFETGEIVGRINLKMLRSGKVKEGQKVNIKLIGYPYLEYGIVRGIVKAKSPIPAGDAYTIEVDLPEGLTTLYGRKLDFTQNMQGNAEIITDDDLRLLQKIINPLRYLATKNRN